MRNRPAALLLLITICWSGLNIAIAQGPNEIQTHGKVCANPARPCSAGGVFSDSDLSFALPAKVEWQRNYYSANFYAIVLKSKAVVSDETPDTDNCKQSFFPADERRAAQSLFPARKVFASEFGCYLVRIVYTNINYKYNFLAVYAGESPAQAQIALREVKATGKFPGANVRKMQVVFQNGD